MKKSIFVLSWLVLVLIYCFGAAASPQKMDALLKITKADPYAGKVMLGKAVSLAINYESVDCLVKSWDPWLTAEAITDAGGETRTIIGNIMTATIPLKYLDEISDREEVVFIEAAKPMNAKMNMARNYTRVAEVQSGSGLSQAYLGANTLVGVVDDSLDWRHADFKGSDNSTRICYIYQNTGSTVRECTKSDIDNNSCSIGAGGSAYHGTHVTGIAAGADSLYTGVAPDGFIAFAINSPTDPDSSGSFSTTVLDGVSKIFAKADSLDMPSVINLSLGTSLGAHDDTSLLEQGLNAAVSGKQGRVIVNAAGNEQLNSNDPDWGTIGGIHASFDVNNAQDEGWGVAIRNTAIGGYSSSAMVDIWLDNTSACRNTTIEVKAYPRSKYNLFNTANADFSTAAIDFNADNTASNTSTDGKVGVNVYTDTSNTENNRPEGLVLIAPTSSGSWSDIAIGTSTGYFFDVIFRAPASSCRGEMWVYPDQTALIDFLSIGPVAIAGVGGYQLSNGDSSRTITIPGTASGVITVGSYMGRESWVDINGITHFQTVYDSTTGGTGGTVGNISLFSSLGPTGEIAGARTKPDLVAPGEPIISTKSSGSSFSDVRLGDSTHVKLEGTSMSTPHVTGIIALLLEKNNCLTTDQVRSALTTTATNVGSPVPNDTYGYGKVDALAAMLSISSNTTCYSGISCGSGGGGGGGGCGGNIMATTSTATSVAALAALPMPLGILIARRKK